MAQPRANCRWREIHGGALPVQRNVRMTDWLELTGQQTIRSLSE
jgi:hypothetical protein